MCAFLAIHEHRSHSSPTIICNWYYCPVVYRLQLWYKSVWILTCQKPFAQLIAQEKSLQSCKYLL